MKLHPQLKICKLHNETEHPELHDRHSNDTRQTSWFYCLDCSTRPFFSRIIGSTECYPTSFTTKLTIIKSQKQLSGVEKPKTCG